MLELSSRLFDGLAQGSDGATSEDPGVERGSIGVEVIHLDHFAREPQHSLGRRGEPSEDAAAPDLPLSLIDEELRGGESEPNFASRPGTGGPVSESHSDAVSFGHFGTPSLDDLGGPSQAFRQSERQHRLAQRGRIAGVPGVLLAKLNGIDSHPARQSIGVRFLDEGTLGRERCSMRPEWRLVRSNGIAFQLDGRDSIRSGEETDRITGGEIPTRERGSGDLRGAERVEPSFDPSARRSRFGSPTATSSDRGETLPGNSGPGARDDPTLGPRAGHTAPKRRRLFLRIHLRPKNPRPSGPVPRCPGSTPDLLAFRKGSGWMFERASDPRSPRPGRRGVPSRPDEPPKSDRSPRKLRPPRGTPAPLRRAARGRARSHGAIGPRPARATRGTARPDLRRSFEIPRLVAPERPRVGLLRG